MLIQISGHNGITNFEGLNIETCNPGNFTVASFQLHRDISVRWEDLEAFNEIKIVEGPFIFFDGYIDLASRTIKPDTFDIQILGWSAILNQCGTTADITVVGAANNQASDFINNVMFIDTDITDFLTAGDIDTTDHAYQANTRLEFAPYTSYFDALEQFNQPNDYDFGCEEDTLTGGHKFYWRPKDDTIDWVVSTNDCNSINISPNPALLCNLVIASYTPAGSINLTVTSEDTDSQAKYGRTIYHHIDIPGNCQTIDAQAIADQYIADYKDLKVTAEFTCQRIFDINGAEHHLAEVRAGDIVRVLDWLPGEELLQAVNVTDITTFRIKSTSYSHDDYSLQVTPTEFVSQIEVTLARLEAKAY